MNTAPDLVLGVVNHEVDHADGQITVEHTNVGRIGFDPRHQAGDQRDHAGDDAKPEAKLVSPQPPVGGVPSLPPVESGEPQAIPAIPSEPVVSAYWLPKAGPAIEPTRKQGDHAPRVMRSAAC